MVKIAYMKSLNGMEHYIPEKDINTNSMNIISISQNYLYVMAEDEGIVEGAYKIINMNKEVFNNLKEATYDKNKSKITGLLKKIHEQNKETLKKSSIHLRICDSRHGKTIDLEKRKQAYVDYFKNKIPTLDLK